jgi:hypothetical protein
VSATTIRYGRRGGGWLPQLAAREATDARPGTPADKQARAIARDPYLWPHPERLAQARAHQARHRGVCANDRDRGEPCDCQPNPAVLAALWAGRARMAGGRSGGGHLLNDLDRQALHLEPGAESR